MTLTSDKRDALLELSTPLIVDGMHQIGLSERFLDPAIRPVVPFTRMVGTAVTVSFEAVEDPAQADLTQYKQAQAKPGKVFAPIMVIEVPAVHRHRGIFGESAALVARIGGYVGALVDGAVRDAHELQEMEFATFSRAISPGYIVGRVRTKDVGDPVQIGEQTIASGDVIVADHNGVVAIASEQLDEVIESARAVKQWEQAYHNALAKGIPYTQAAEMVGTSP